ncbi:MAG: hypothetical protein SGILL_009092, partial [Bacillariaceae sp.]
MSNAKMHSSAPSGRGDKDAKYSTIETATVLTSHAGRGDSTNSTTIRDDSSSSENNGVFLRASMDMETSSSEFVKGAVQEPEYRDKWFAVAFLAQLTLVVSAAIMYATGVLSTDLVSISSENDDGPTRRFLTSVVSHDEYQWSSGMNDDQIDSIQQQDQEEVEDMDPMDVYIFVSAFLFSLAMAPLLAIFAMGFMLKNAIGLVKFSLILPIALNAVA